MKENNKLHIQLALTDIKIYLSDKELLESELDGITDRILKDLDKIKGVLEAEDRGIELDTPWPFKTTFECMKKPHKLAFEYICDIIKKTGEEKKKASIALLKYYGEELSDNVIETVIKDIYDNSLADSLKDIFKDLDTE